jgi:hypothetical protein
MTVDCNRKNWVFLFLHAIFSKIHFRINCKPINFTEQNVYQSLNEVVEPENRHAFVTTPFIMNRVYRNSYKSGGWSIFVAKENVAPMYSGFVMHVALKDIITLKATQYHESGILSHALKKHYSLEGLNPEPEPIGAQILTLRHLSLGFIIICGLLMASIVVFMVECTPKVSRKVFELCLKCYIVVKFVRMNKII